MSFELNTCRFTDDPLSSSFSILIILITQVYDRYTSEGACGACDGEGLWPDLDAADNPTMLGLVPLDLKYFDRDRTGVRWARPCGPWAAPWFILASEAERLSSDYFSHRSAFNAVADSLADRGVLGCHKNTIRKVLPGILLGMRWVQRMSADLGFLLKETLSLIKEPMEAPEGMDRGPLEQLEEDMARLRAEAIKYDLVACIETCGNVSGQCCEACARPRFTYDALNDLDFSLGKS